MIGLLDLPRVQKSLLLMFVDMLVLPLALLSAFCLRYSDVALLLYIDNNSAVFLWVTLAGPLVFLKLGLYRAVVRYIGWDALWSIVGAVVLLSVTLYPLSWLVDDGQMPRSVPIIFGIVAMLYVGGSRAIARQYYKHAITRFAPRKRAIIYGAGSAGMQLMQALHITDNYAIVAFIDDDTNKWKTTIRGVRIKSPERLPDLIGHKAIDVVLLAMPSASGRQRKRVLDMLADYPVFVQTVPAMTDILTGKAQLASLREIEVEELLGRDAVPPNSDLLGKSISQKAVMVTGAGGSIGSELCRQIAAQSPSCLVLFEMSEYALYAIHQELNLNFPQLKLFPVLGSVVDANRVLQVLAQFSIQTVYHAAAYKHVPLVEHNIIEGVRNNVLGTKVVAESALAAGVTLCVLVSTDKAVRPTNVMGATKRLAEQLLQNLARDSQTTLFTMVRFGNVLGSSGSVVPVFRQQLAQGGPIYVTHPDITRYFMTIPEAASLVIQAGAMAQGGDVFVLDMGDSVKILDLAKRMIHLSGLEVKDEKHPDGDIEITFSGLRPGEKLYEELLIGADVIPSEHPKIARAQEDCLSREKLDQGLTTLFDGLASFNPEAVRANLQQLVPEFNPVSDCVDWMKS
jgi:FlaA1/EpsC-like NDP-sugar epimerase